MGARLEEKSLERKFQGSLMFVISSVSIILYLLVIFFNTLPKARLKSFGKASLVTITKLAGLSLGQDTSDRQ